MPIEYESPAPMGVAASVYSDAARIQQQQQAARFQAEQQMVLSRGGGPNIQDTGLQDAVLHSQQLGDARTTRNMAYTQTPQSEVLRANAADRQQAEHFRLQAELSQVQLTQAEKMRLERLKNSIGAVSSDATLSDDEKANLVTQLKTGIDPLQQRLNQENVKSQAQLRQQQATDFQMRAALEKQKFDIQGMDPDKRYHFQADPQALAEISADLAASLGDKRKFIPDALFAKMVKDEAVKQGLGHHAYMQPDGKIEVMGKHGDGSGGGKAGQFDHPSGLTPNEYLKALHEAERAVMEDSKSTKEHPTIPGTKVQAHPELATQEERDKAVAAIMSRRKLPADFEEYTADLKKSAGGKVGYDHKKSPWAQKEQVATVATPPAPTGTAPVHVRVADLDTQNEKLQVMDGLTEGEKSKAASLFAETRWLVQKEPDPKKRAEKYPEDAKRLDAMAAELAPILKKAKPPAPEVTPAAQPATAATPRGIGGTVWTNRNF